MGTMRTYHLPVNADIGTIVHLVSQNLSSQGFMCQSSVMSPQTAMLVVTKDNDDFKKLIGMGIECRCNIAVMGNQLSVNIESEWTNKIIAMAVGWFVCLVPLITGIIGAIGQSELPNKIDAAFGMTIASLNGGQQNFQQPYNQAPYQQPYQQQPTYQQNSAPDFNANPNNNQNGGF